MQKSIESAADPRVGVTFRPLTFSGYQTGALDIGTSTGRRIISIPTQLGCRVGCTFCVSSATPLKRNLTAEEMLQMVQRCLDEQPADGRPIELSFTGEGEALLNWRQASDVCRELLALSHDFNASIRLLN